MSKEIKGSDIKEQLLQYRKSMDRLYYISIAILVGYNIFGSSTMSHYFFEWLYGLFGDMPGDLKTLIVETICLIRYLIIFPALYNIIVEVKERKIRIVMVCMLLLGWFYTFYWREFSNTTIFEVMVVMVASYGKDFKKAGYRSIVIAAVILIVSFLLSIAGVLPDFIKMRGDMERHAFGMMYCTDLAAHWCFLLLTCMFIKDGKMKWWFYVGAAILSVLNIVFVDARNSLIIVVLACIGSIVYQSVSKKEVKTASVISNVFQWGLTFSFVILAGLYMILNFAYSQSLVAILEKIPGFSASIIPRLATSRRATMMFPISLFGSPYIQIGDGMGTSEILGIYTFLDDSYISVYVIYGIVGLLLMLSLVTYGQYRLKREGHIFRLFIVSLVAIDCFVEHHWTETGYNIFLLLPFMDFSQQTGAADKGVTEDKAAEEQEAETDHSIPEE